VEVSEEEALNWVKTIKTEIVFFNEKLTSMETILEKIPKLIIWTY